MFAAMKIFPLDPNAPLANWMNPELKLTPPVKLLFGLVTDQVLVPDLLRETLPVPLSVIWPEKTLDTEDALLPTRFKVRAASATS